MPYCFEFAWWLHGVHVDGVVVLDPMPLVSCRRPSCFDMLNTKFGQSPRGRWISIFDVAGFDYSTILAGAIDTGEDIWRLGGAWPQTALCERLGEVLFC